MTPFERLQALIGELPANTEQRPPIRVAFDLADRAALLHGQAIDLPLGESTVDALVCDPPSGIGFMGKSWDGDRGGWLSWSLWLAEQLAPAFRALKPGAHGLVWALPRTSWWTALALHLCGFEIRDRVSHMFLNGFPKSLDVSKAIDKSAGAVREIVGKNPHARPIDGAGGGYTGPTSHDPHITAPATDDAKRWNGWGTALKPALEDWWLVRKPLTGTVAANVLTFGTGAINVDACRIEWGDDRPADRAEGKPRRTDNDKYGKANETINPQNDAGRWPPHLLVDEGVAIDGIDEPARYFYCPKPSTSERDAGLDHLEARSGGEATDREDGSKGLENPRAGAGRGGGRRNFHPTVKSVALMRWLIKLITPPGGLVLDPFTGSGTTAVAALAEGCRFVGVEMTDEYLPIIEGRSGTRWSRRSRQASRRSAPHDR